MSSTTNAQSYLSYVFRPVYTWNSNTGAFSTLFNMSNIDTLSVNNAKFGVIYAGDINNNVYIGSNTGNLPALVGACNASSNTAVGIASAAAISGSSNSEFIGYQAGSVGRVICNSIVIGASAALSNSNVSNSILIGTSNSAGLSNIFTTISIGGNAGGTGSSNIFIGSSNGLGMLGSSNVLIGHGVNLASIPGYFLVDGTTPGPSFSNASNLFMVGSSNKILIAGNFSNGVVSIGSTNTNANVCNAGAGNALVSNTLSNISLDVSKYMRIQSGLSIGCDPDQGYTLDSVGSFRVQDGFGQISLSNNYDIGDGAPDNTSNSIVTIGPVQSTGSTMTVNVGGTLRVSNVTVSNQLSASNIVVSNASVSNQVSAGVGYCSVQSGSSGVRLLQNATTTIPLKNSGLVVISLYNSASTPVCYNGVWMANQITSPVAVRESSNVALTYTVVLSTTTITITNTFAGSLDFFYNITFFPIS